MIKKSETYEHPTTGIVFEVSFVQNKETEDKVITIKNHRNRHDFTFIKSNPIVVRRVAQALLEISGFVENL